MASLSPSTSARAAPSYCAAHCFIDIADVASSGSPHGPTSHSTCCGAFARAWAIAARASSWARSSMRLCARRASQISVSATKHCAPAIDSRRSASRIVSGSTKLIYSASVSMSTPWFASANASGAESTSMSLWKRNSISAIRAPFLRGERGAKRDRSVRGAANAML